MKKITTLLLIIVTISSIFAQSPNSFKYQTVVRDAAGEVLPNQDISFQISILQGSATGSSVYSETHLVTTNDFGLVNLIIGGGSTSDDFSTIDWGNGPFFIKIELDENGGTAYSEMGTSQLLSVPYAMYANDVANKDDADADPNNELQIMNFSNDTLYLDNGGQVYLGEYSSLWEQNDTNIFYNNGWVGVGTSTPSGMMVVQGDDGVDPDSALFEVKNKDGQTIFAVYDGGVRIWVDDTGAKTNTDKGGFAVGGYRLNKSITSEYLRVTPDSVRVYIREDDGTKINTDKGGFAVGGYRLNKSLPSQYFNINADLEADTLNPSEARIYWYPLKEAFLSGRVLVESADSVGLNSWASGFESKSIGDYSQALGYRARANGNNSTAIGYYANADSSNSYALGNNSYVGGINSYSIGNGANVIGEGSYAIGSGARASGDYSFSIGSNGVDSTGVSTSPTIASGDYSYAFGMGSLSSGIGSFAIGTMDISSNYYTIAMGYQSEASNYFSVAIGSYATSSGESAVSIGYRTSAEGDYSTALGYRNTTTGERATAFGGLNTASGSTSTAFGSGTTASGIASLSCGYGTIASGAKSSSFGHGTEAIGEGSFAIGNSTKAEGEYSIATGINTIAFGGYSFAIGGSTQALNFYSVASGDRSKSSGILSFTHGYELVSRSYDEFVIGRFNDTTTSTYAGYWSWVDPIFVVGNGDDDANRHNAFIIKKDGYVGIGVNPSEILDIYGSSPNIELTNEDEDESGIIFNDAQAITTQYAKILFNSSSRNLSFYTSSTTPRIIINPSGYVGIGTSTLGSHRLIVNSDVSGTSGSSGFFLNSSSSGLAMIIETSSYASSDNTLLVTQRGSTGDIASFDSYHGSSTGWDREFKFTNNGDGRCDGSWIAGGADYAEFFPKANINIEYEAGDIITMSPNKTYTVEGATKENAQLMIGVYSSNPAIVGNAEAEKDPENSVLVGMVGVIKTKVNTENGPIKIGDYITISSTPKVGMKATKNGMVVGRAMDNYDSKGTGMINVLVETDWYYNTEEGNITSSEIKNTLNKQQYDIEILKSEIEQLKQILEVKAEK